MKETDFIKQNKKKWARFEKLSHNKSNDPDEVSRLFTEITEDLSYARTFYPRRSVRVYLNQLSQGVFTNLYRQRKQPIGSFAKFWTQTVPLEMYRARRNLLVAFVFFMLAAIVGAVSQQYDFDFIRVIVGDGYVRETERNIAAGNPMGIYGDSGGGYMFFYITINNIRVAFMAFVGGVLLTLGSFALLLKNGVMLGAFQWWFNGKGLLLTTFLAIWIHGAFEISAIIIAGAAGITVGNGIIFPKSYSRIQSLIFAAKRGMTIMLSLIPVFIMAGALESFVTRYYLTMPTALKLFIILGSFSIILFYYVFYPYKVAKKYPEKLEVKEIPRFIPMRKIKWFKIRKPGEVFADTFTLYLSYFGKMSRIFFTIVLPIAAVMIAIVFAWEYSRFNYSFNSRTWEDVMGILFGTGSSFEWYKFLGWCIPFALLIATPFFVITDNNEEGLIKHYFKFLVRHYIWLYCYALLVFTVFLFSPGLILFLLALMGPFLNVIPCIIIYEKVNFFTAISKCFFLGNGGYADSLISFFGLIAITSLFFFILHNPFEMGIVNWLINDLLRDTLITVTEYYSVVIAIIDVIIYMVYFFFIFTLSMISFALIYHSNEERKTAKGLYERLAKFGKRSRTFETELDFE